MIEIATLKTIVENSLSVSRSPARRKNYQQCSYLQL